MIDIDWIFEYQKPIVCCGLKKYKINKFKVTLDSCNLIKFKNYSYNETNNTIEWKKL